MLTKFTLNDILTYSSTPPERNETNVENAFNYQNKNAYLETRHNDHFFKFGFNNLSITLTAYKITSSYHTVNASHLRSWDLYGSNDDLNWHLVHRVEYDNKLNGKFNTAVYQVRENTEVFKFFLLKNVTTYYLTNKIMLADFDVYDTVFSKLLAITIPQKRTISSRLSLQYLLVMFLK